jgi:hypothetical protein
MCNDRINVHRTISKQINTLSKIRSIKPQLSEKERHLSFRDVVQQWFFVLTCLFLILSPSPL